MFHAYVAALEERKPREPSHSQERDSTAPAWESAFSSERNRRCRGAAAVRRSQKGSVLS